MQGFGGSAPAEDAATAKGFTTDVAVADTDVGVEGLTAATATTAKGFTTDVGAATAAEEDEFDADEFDADEFDADAPDPFRGRKYCFKATLL